LKPVVIGQPLVPWFRLTLPILVALIGLCGVIYSPKYTRGGGLDYSDFVWIQRRDHRTGQVMSLNLTTLDSENNSEKSTKSAHLRNLIEVFLPLSYETNPTQMFHTIRDPFKPIRFVFSTGQSSLNSEETITYFPSLKSHLMLNDSAKVMILEDIYGIIDLLVYKKYLDSIPSSHVSIPRTKHITSATNETNTMTNLKSKKDLLDELNILAREKCHIHDLSKLEKEIDTYCLTKLRISTLTAGDTHATVQQQQLQKEEMIMKLTKIRIFESFHQQSDPSLLLTGNWSEENQKSEINDRNSILHFIENHHLYEEELKEKLGIIFTLEQSDQITNAYHRDEERRQWYTQMTQFAENTAFYGVVLGIPTLVLTMILKPN
jgi:hypothetical protein